MSTPERFFHETWLGMVQPVDGLVVSIPVLLAHQVLARVDAATQHHLREQTIVPVPHEAEGQTELDDLARTLDAILGLGLEYFDDHATLPTDLSLFVPDGGQTLRPTLGLRAYDSPPPLADDDPESTPASRAGHKYVALVWDLTCASTDTASVGRGLDLDKSETMTGPWLYPPAAKFERLLRHCRIPIGLLSNAKEVRLIYAPHGEATGSITFRVADMCKTGGRPILDAFVMLLHRDRWFGVAHDQSLPALLAESRKRQAEVTNALADQVFDALGILLAGFEAAAERDGVEPLHDALRQSEDHLYGGLLSVLLRLVFQLYAEDRNLLPIDRALYADNYGVLALFDRLQDDAGRFPDAMDRRFGAYSQLVASWRIIHGGASHADFRIPARRGSLFDPDRHGFLERWGDGGSSPLHRDAYEERAQVRVPSIADGVVHRVLERLLFLDRQRLSYKALDVEQIGSVYEALMGYKVVELKGAAVCLRPQRAKAVWLSASEVLAQPKSQQAKWLQDEVGLVKAHATKIAGALAMVKSDEAALDVLAGFRVRCSEVRPAGRLAIQPGHERRRTSSHYTPRWLAERVVRRTLEPLMLAMGSEPSSAQLLELKICDPAMGSGAFLVAVVRYLGDQLVAAWTREHKLAEIAHEHEDAVLRARRLVAQICVYGVDKNPFAVELAKLSLWLVTLARDLPFTFVDHTLREGDSLVGLDFEQITAFHWGPGPATDTISIELRSVLDLAVRTRQEIAELAQRDDPRSVDQREVLLRDALDYTRKLREAGDLVLAAFFGAAKPAAREKARVLLLDQARGYLTGEGRLPPALALAREAFLEQVASPFHWMLEFPEVFFEQRPDPLDRGRVNKTAFMDAFVGNPPFMGGSQVSGTFGLSYLDWLKEVHPGAHGNADLSAHFFRRADALLGAHGAVGFIATNTIGQGDTRSTGLQYLVSTRGYQIYDAVRSMPWPAVGAAVTVSIVHLAHGTPAACGLRPMLHDPDPNDETKLVTRKAEAINSRLRPKPERADAGPLRSNAGLSFLGSKIYGQGFVLTPVERDALIAKEARNAERIFPYLGGEEVNTNPDQSYHRYVISFGDMELHEAEKWPDLMAILREKVKPEGQEQPRSSQEVLVAVWRDDPGALRRHGQARPRAGLFPPHRTPVLLVSANGSGA